MKIKTTVLGNVRIHFPEPEPGEPSLTTTLNHFGLISAQLSGIPERGYDLICSGPPEETLRMLETCARRLAQLIMQEMEAKASYGTPETPDAG